MDKVVFSSQDVDITLGQNDTRNNAVTRKMQGEWAPWAPREGSGRIACDLKFTPAGPPCIQGLGDGFVLVELDRVPP